MALYDDAKVGIVYATRLQPFINSSIVPNTNIDDIINKPFKIMPFPKFVMSARFGNYDRGRITIDIDEKWFKESYLKLPEGDPLAASSGLLNYFADREINKANEGDLLERDFLIKLGNYVGNFQETVTVYFEENLLPVLLTYMNTCRFMDRNDYDKLPSVELNALKEYAEKNYDDHFLISQDTLSCYRSVKNYNGKIFYNSMVNWFTNNFPNLIVKDTVDESKKITETGLRIFLGFFLSNIGVKSRMSAQDFPADTLFSIHIPTLYSSKLFEPLSGKLVRAFDRRVKPNGDESIITNEDNNKVHPLSSYGHGYGPTVITDLNLEKTYNSFEKTSWITFIRNKANFLEGCQIIFAAGEIIIDEYDEKVLIGNELMAMLYRGSHYEKVEKRNTLEIIHKKKLNYAEEERIKTYFYNNHKVGVIFLKVTKMGGN